MVDNTYKIQFFDRTTNILILTIAPSDYYEIKMLQQMQKEITLEMDREILKRMLAYATEYNINASYGED